MKRNSSSSVSASSNVLGQDNSSTQKISSSSESKAITVKDLKSWGFDRVWRGKYQENPLYKPYIGEENGACVKSIYTKDHTKPNANIHLPLKKWIGKLGLVDTKLSTNVTSGSINRMRRGISRDAVKEKIAGDCYTMITRCNGGIYAVPKWRLAHLPIINQHTEQNPLAQALAERSRQPEQAIRAALAVHVMSKMVDGYQDLEKAQVIDSNHQLLGYIDYFKKTNKLSDFIYVDDKRIPLVGLVELLAAARVLADIDVLGNGGKNAGYIVIRDKQGVPLHARVVKVDPGYSFTTDYTNQLYALKYRSSSPIQQRQERPLKDEKDIQIGTTADWIISWENLTVSQRERFLRVLQSGINLLSDSTIVTYLIKREGQFNLGAGEDRPLLREEGIAHLQDDIRWNVKLQEEAYKYELAQLLEDREPSSLVISEETKFTGAPQQELEEKTVETQRQKAELDRLRQQSNQQPPQENGNERNRGVHGQEVRDRLSREALHERSQRQLRFQQRSASRLAAAIPPDESTLTSVVRSLFSWSSPRS